MHWCAIHGRPIGAHAGVAKSDESVLYSAGRQLRDQQRQELGLGVRDRFAGLRQGREERPELAALPQPLEQQPIEVKVRSPAPHGSPHRLPGPEGLRAEVLRPPVVVQLASQATDGASRRRLALARQLVPVAGEGQAHRVAVEQPGPAPKTGNDRPIELEMGGRRQTGEHGQDPPGGQARRTQRVQLAEPAADPPLLPALRRLSVDRARPGQDRLGPPPPALPIGHMIGGEQQRQQLQGAFAARVVALCHFMDPGDQAGAQARLGLLRQALSRSFEESCRLATVGRRTFRRVSEEGGSRQPFETRRHSPLAVSAPQLPEAQGQRQATP